MKRKNERGIIIKDQPGHPKKERKDDISKAPRGKRRNQEKKEFEGWTVEIIDKQSEKEEKKQQRRRTCNTTEADPQERQKFSTCTGVIRPTFFA